MTSSTPPESAVPLPPVYAAIVALWAGCVVEGGLASKDDAPPAFDSGDDDSVPTDTSTTRSDDPCDGLDNDGDGGVDEGWPDTDGDGRADCAEATCPELDLGEAGEVAVEAACQGDRPTPVTDPWDVEIRWQLSGSTSAAYPWVYATPVVGNLDDDDGDGDVDADDDADVVVNAGGTLLALDGATGAEKWAWPGVGLMHSVAVADVTGDGRPDVVSILETGAVVCLGGDGYGQWQSGEVVTNRTYAGITAADLDADGVVEVIADDLVVDGRDGSTRFHLRVSSSPYPLRTAAVADLDLDGAQEVILAGTVWDADGLERWASGVTGSYGLWPVVVQADADPTAEVAFVGDRYTLFDDDGTLLAETTYGTPAHPGPPCAGDFDGDGAMEVAWPSAGSLVLAEVDGTIAWTAAIDDVSGVAGCAGWDVDGDGILEVLYADEQSFWILDGPTGVARFEDPGHQSATIFEYPSVADVDGDGHGEILLASSLWSGAWGMLTVYGHAGDGWPAAGADWGLHDYSVTNLDGDGRVPTVPAPAWTTAGVYRGRAPEPGPLPDLVARITDVCVADCAWGPVQVAVQVENRGAADVEAGVGLTLQALESTGPRTVASVVLPAVPAGTALAGVELSLSPEDVGAEGFALVVDPEGRVEECDEAGNTDTWSDVFCP